MEDSNQDTDPVLLPFLLAPNEAQAARELDVLTDMAAPIVRRISRSGHTSNDAYQETMARLVKKLQDLRAGQDKRPIADYAHYVSVVASHAVKGEQREENPQYRSVKDALRHLLNRDERFAIWRTESGQQLCGLATWRCQQTVLSRNNRLMELVNDPTSLAEALRAQGDIRKLDLARLLHEIFNWVNQPVLFNELAGIVFVLKGEFSEPPKPGQLSPEEQAARTELLGRVWFEIEQLPPLQKMAYLLNFTSGDGQLHIFPFHQVATIREIGRTLAISDEQFECLWLELLGTKKECSHARSLESYDERFALLWWRLPLTDEVLAKMLHTERQKIINLRWAASVRLSRRLGRAR